MDNLILNSYSKISNLNVSRETCNELESLITMIQEKNKKINIISKKMYEKEAIRERHIIDSAQIIDYGNEIDEQIEINSHYRGYLKKQKADILAFKRDENLTIPDNIDYDQFSGLSNEVKAKFKEIKPKTMGQALRIDGITPAAVYILLSHVKRKSIKHIA